MNNVVKILGTVGKVLFYLIVAMGSLLSIFLAYTLLAPDTMPKPVKFSDLLPAVALEGSAEPVSETPAVEPTHEENPIPGSGVMVDTGTKIINLAETGGNKYIRINVVLEFAEPPETTPEVKAAEGEGVVVTAATELSSKINARLPMINDTVITLLSSKTFEELYTTTGKEALRGELMQRLQAMMPEYKLIGVYFTEFVVE